MSYSDPYINAIFLACRKTSKSLIRDFGEVEKLQVSLKGVSDFVSLADTKAEKMLIKELTYSYPKINIIAEETGVIKILMKILDGLLTPLMAQATLFLAFHTLLYQLRLKRITR